MNKNICQILKDPLLADTLLVDPSPAIGKPVSQLDEYRMHEFVTDRIERSRKSSKLKLAAQRLKLADAIVYAHAEFSDK